MLALGGLLLSFQVLSNSFKFIGGFIHVFRIRYFIDAGLFTCSGFYRCMYDPPASECLYGPPASVCVTLQRRSVIF